MKIFWFIEKPFDSTLDKATFLEMAIHLQKDMDVYLVTGFEREKVQFEGLKNKIIYIHSPTFPFINRFLFYLNQIRAFQKICNDYKPEILFMNTNNFFLIKKMASLKHRYKYKAYLDIRTLSVYTSAIMNKLDSILLRRSLRAAAKSFDGVTYITEEIKHYCQEEFDLPDHRSEIWTSGVNIKIFEPAEDQKVNSGLRLIYHGSLSSSRGLGNLIKAMDLINNHHDCELLLLGSGNEWKELRNLVSMLHLQKRVSFHAPVPYAEVPRFIHRADAGVLPFPDWVAWNTSSPLKLFEYLSCGKPVIASEIPAHLNVLQGKDYVVWAKDSSPEQLAEAIERLYAHKEEFKRRASKARDFVIANYTWERQAQKLQRFIRG